MSHDTTQGLLVTQHAPLDLKDAQHLGDDLAIPHELGLAQAEVFRPSLVRELDGGGCPLALGIQELKELVDQGVQIGTGGGLGHGQVSNVGEPLSGRIIG
jgi:hypothetical protein